MSKLNDPKKELDEIADRYERRKKNASKNIYGAFQPYNLMLRLERDKAITTLLGKWIDNRSFSDFNILEIGCGNGVNLSHMLMLGASPDRLIANELLPDRLEAARKHLPADVKVVGGNALDLDISPASLDLIIQSTVFSSILSGSLKQDIAKQMLSWLRPGGAILWYDFTFDNPKNLDVRGISLREIRTLFAGTCISVQKVTLAPPISRKLGAFTSFLYPILNIAPFLRTHVCCLIEKK